jgi:hypothetical protein
MLIGDMMAHKNDNLATSLKIYAVVIVIGLIFMPLNYSMNPIAQKDGKRVQKENIIWPEQIKHLPWLKKVNEVVIGFESLFESAKKALPEQKNHKEQEALQVYNLLRKIVKYPSVKLFSQIDVEWYNNFSIHFSTILYMNEISGLYFEKSFPSMIHDLEISNQHQTCNENEQIALNLYNVFRESVNQPVAISADEIDLAWFKNFPDKFASFSEFSLATNNWARKPLLEDATVAQKNLVRCIKRKLGIKDEIIVAASTFDTGLHAQAMPSGSNKYHFLVLGGTDQDLHVHAIYHELGHIVHGVQEIVEDYDSFFKQPAVKGDLNRIDHYIELGKKAFNSTSNIGKHVLKILSHYDNFWNNSSLDQVTRARIEFGRAQEKRADLFALDNQFKHEKLNTILAPLYFYVYFDYIVVEGSSDIHPSTFERALYFAGFLVDKGIDVNAAFKKFEEKGICRDYTRIVPEKELISKKSRKLRIDIKNAFKVGILEDLCRTMPSHASCISQADVRMNP